MAKRISDAERTMAFFRTAPIEVAQTVLTLAKAEVKLRTGKPERTSPTPTTTVRRKTTSTPPAVTTSITATTTEAA